MINGNSVATLTFNQLHGGSSHQQIQDGSMFQQYQQQGNNGMSRGRIAVNLTAGSS
jgi:uncharacterized protein YpbB